MINHKLEEIAITDTIQQAVTAYNIPGGWDIKDPNIASFKEEIKEKLLSNQGGKCAYCGLPLSTRNPEIDHIAPKGGSKLPRHTECTFLPINLVYACHHCNSPACKGKKDTVLSKNGSPNYRQWSFTIVHPYLDDPVEYFEFGGSDNIILLPKRDADIRMQQKARCTIEMFALDSEPVITEIAKQRFLESHPEVIRAIIAEISTYKPQL